MKHTKEPWIVGEHGIEAEGEPILFYVDGDHGFDEDVANLERAADCVTALAGIEDPAKLRKQRDALREACKGMTVVAERLRKAIHAGGSANLAEISEAANAARVALAACEGE